MALYFTFPGRMELTPSASRTPSSDARKVQRLAESEARVRSLSRGLLSRPLLNGGTIPFRHRQPEEEGV